MHYEKKSFILDMKTNQLKMGELRSVNSQAPQTNFVHLINYGHTAKPRLCFKAWKVVKLH